MPVNEANRPSVRRGLDDGGGSSRQLTPSTGRVTPSCLMATTSGHNDLQGTMTSGPISAARTCTNSATIPSSECDIYDHRGRSECNRYYSETIQNNKFVTIAMYVSAPLLDLIKYTSRYI
jgi:hypothetical protein